jgi:hypothetical protein
VGVKEIKEAPFNERPRQFIALNTEAKPLTLPVGSTIYEKNTTDMYIFDGTSWWNMETGQEVV